MSFLSKINNLGIGVKLFIGFALMVAISMVIFAIGFNTLSEYSTRSAIVSAVSTGESALISARTSEKNFLLRGDSSYIDEAKKRAQKGADTIEGIRDKLMSPDNRRRVDDILSGAKKYQQLLDKLAISVKSDSNNLDSVEKELLETARAMVATSSELQGIQEKRIAEQYKSAVTNSIVTVSLALILALIIAWVLMGNIKKPISEIVQIANRIASGDLTVDVKETRGDEFGQLQSAFSTMVVSLRELIREIENGSSNIASASEELSTVTDHTNDIVAQQSDQTDQVATAMTEMAATVNEIAKNAESAFEAASRASDKSDNGENIVNETLEQMTTLNKKISSAAKQIRALQADTQNIETVLDVIKNVAEQTNLLALNAAIEAARAGEQGRGFAVVADEVRSLAKRTHSSASEIESLIVKLLESAEDSVNAMDSGSELASQTLERARTAGSVIREASGAVDEIREINSQIATAAEQQASVAEDINKNVTQIRDLGEQSSTATAQVSGASDELARLAEGLSHQVSRFKV